MFRSKQCIFDNHIDYSGPGMASFREVTSEEVREIIRSSPPKSCSLDPVPTSLLLKCLDSTIEYIREIINLSLRSGTVPKCFKEAIVIPILKKSNLDPENFKNFRPVSNLPFISKILEKAVLMQLKEHLASNNLLEKFQSAYRQNHSTETALLRIVNDILESCDNGNVSVVTLLDLSAAFDTIDHDILCDSLRKNFGLSDTALAWFRSYLADRSLTVVVDGNSSLPMPLKYGVPQGSVLGPVLYVMYTMSLGRVIDSHSVSHHMYADDTQLYDSCAPSNFMSLSQNLERCCSSIKSWMTSNKLKLNEEKTEVLLCGTESMRKKIGAQSVTIANADINIVSKAKNLGVILDSSLSMEHQINYVVKVTNYELCRISRMKQYLPIETLKTVVSSLVLSRLDYCNSLFAGLPDGKIEKIQKIQNRAARLVLGRSWYDNSSTKDMLRTLHWLPVKARIEYKIALLCFKTQHSLAPPYLQELLSPYTPSRTLRSTNDKLLKVPRTKLKRFGDRAFYKFGPMVWNSLPPSVTLSCSVSSFKKNLKTHLFRKYL